MVSSKSTTLSQYLRYLEKKKRRFYCWDKALLSRDLVRPLKKHLRLAMQQGLTHQQQKSDLHFWGVIITFLP